MSILSLSLRVINREKGPEVAPRVREARFIDYPRIASLQSRYGLSPRNYEQWERLWTHNPFYKELPNWPIGWVLEIQSEIVGYIGNIPLLYEIDKRTIVTAASHHFVVDVTYRGHSLSLISRYYSQGSANLFLTVGANAQASRVCTGFRMSRVPAGSWDHSVFWITHYPGFVASLLLKKGVCFTRLLSRPLAAGLFVKEKFGKGKRQTHAGIEVSTSTYFDDRFDRFWQQLRENSSFLLLANRSREALAWHFGYALSQNRAWVVTIDDGPRLAAFAIFCRQDNPKLGLKRQRLVDFQTLDGRTELLEPILSWALEACRRQGIHMLEAVGFGGRKGQVLETLAPYRRALPSWLYFYKANDPDLAYSLRNSDVWDPCCFDGDATLLLNEALF